MDEIMAAMVLTSLSCSPVLGSSSSPADMECGGGELSDSGSSGYWSWDHGNMDSSPDEGLHMELEQGEELSSVRSVYRCLWPSCGKVLTSSVGIKRHIRVLHLGGSDQSQREEDFYYTRYPVTLSDPSSVQLQPAGSGPGLVLSSQPRSNSSSGPGLSRPVSSASRPPAASGRFTRKHLYQVGEHCCSPSLFSPIHVVKTCTVVSTVAAQQEGPEFNSTIRSFCVEFACSPVFAWVLSGYSGFSTVQNMQLVGIG
uniref:Zinc finger protein 395b n=1 Tax=Maylandia zebra TaxID=106582 RepID=A0A3P9C6L2_9CICH